MTMKTQLNGLTLLTAGLLVAGCSQMAAQTTPTELGSDRPEPVKTIVDCSQCAKPTDAKPAQDWSHTHPAIPGCTDSTTHTHPYTDRNHKHSYSCKGGLKQVAPPPPKSRLDILFPRPRREAITTPVVQVPPVKAKGNYRGPINIDQGVMRPYQQ